MTFAKNFMADAGVGSTGSGPWLPMVDSHLPEGLAYGADGAWHTHMPYQNGFADGHHQGPNGHAEYGSIPLIGKTGRKKETLHQKSKRAIEAGRDIYDVLIAWTPVAYAAGLLGVALHGVYEIFSGNPTQGAAELVGSGGLMSQVKKVKRWSDDQLYRYTLKKINRKSGLPEAVADKRAGGSLPLARYILGDAENYRAAEHGIWGQ